MKSSLCILFSCVVVVTSLSGWAEEEHNQEETTGVDALTAAVTRMAEGHRLMASGSFDAAGRAYAAAAEQQPEDPSPVFLLGCAQRAAGQYAEALDAFRRAVELSNARTQDVRARALMNLAWVQEARRDWPAAREAWQAYVAFAQATPELTTHVANARQRLDVITAAEELESAYVAVRERIEQRAAEEARTQP